MVHSHVQRPRREQSRQEEQREPGEQGAIEEPPVKLLRIDDLAHVSGIPSRTIRFYNTKGLLPAPIMQGRTAYYNQEHILVLGLIRELKQQQNLPLETIKHFLTLRTEQGDVQMTLALKQRSLHAFGGQQTRMTGEELLQQTGLALSQLDILCEQGLLFPTEIAEQWYFSGDDLLLVQVYQSLERLGLPLSLPALIRFQMRQLVRSEVAAVEQHVLPHWHEDGLLLEQQTANFEEIMVLTDTLISVMHRRLLYQQD